MAPPVNSAEATLAPQTSKHPNQGFLKRAHRILIYFGAAYAVFVILLAIPYFQLQ